MTLKVLLLSTLGPIFFMGMQISSLQTAYSKIYQRKTVGGLSPIPFLSMFVNGITWTLYGSLKHDEFNYIMNFINLELNLKRRNYSIFYIDLENNFASKLR